jgi:hypothetical protein
MSTVHFSPLLHTPRLTLRLFNDPKDLSILIDLFDSDMTVEHLQLVNVGNYLHRSLLDGEKPPGGAWYMIHLGSVTGPPVGVIMFCQRKEGFAPDIGWQVAPDHQSKGIATEAATEVLRYWHEDFGLKDICALVGKDNIASQKVAEHIGLVRKGTVTFVRFDKSTVEHLVYAFETMREFEGETVYGTGEPEEDEGVESDEEPTSEMGKKEAKTHKLLSKGACSCEIM